MRTQLFDPYERPARLYPALLSAGPLCSVAWVTYRDSDIVTAAVSSSIVLTVAAFALSRIARDAGKRIQDKIFRRWGGPPTVQLLRHRDRHFDPHTKARYHAIIAARLGKSLPTPEEELADPAAADDFYRAATTMLIGATRNRKAFPLVFKENVAYGFHRNALGLRPWGLVGSLFSLAWILATTGALRFVPPGFDSRKVLESPPSTQLSLFFSLAMMAAWIIWFGEQTLKRTAFSYAERLIQSCDHLPPI